MVNQAEQPDTTQSPAPEAGNTTTDITSDFEGVNTFEDTSTAPQDLDTPSDGEVSEPAAEAPTPPPVEESPPPSLEPQDEIKRRLEAVEQQNQQYQNQQYEAQLAQNYQKYRSDLENAGYLPDQAEHVANNWYASVSQQVQMQRQQQDVSEFIQGQQAAAEHFANQYNLGLADLKELRQHSTPTSMEEAAKRMASDREKDTEIARLRAQLVPSQSFEDNQSSPAASNSESRWLERYNQGDRSSEAQAAARRAAGLG